MIGEQNCITYKNIVSGDIVPLKGGCTDFFAARAQYLNPAKIAEGFQVGLGHQTHDKDGVPHDAEHEVQVSKIYTVSVFDYGKPQPHAKRQDWQSCAGIYDGRN